VRGLSVSPAKGVKELSHRICVYSFGPRKAAEDNIVDNDPPKGEIDMKKEAQTSAPLATPGEIVLVLLTISFFLLLLAPSLVSQ